LVQATNQKLRLFFSIYKWLTSLILRHVCSQSELVVVTNRSRRSISGIFERALQRSHLLEFHIIFLDGTIA
jgi:hypothetical protein